MVDQAARERILQPQEVYGYWPAASEGDSIVLFDADEQTRKVARFALPRQNKADGPCIADFLRPIGRHKPDGSPDRDVIGLQVVTVIQTHFCRRGVGDPSQCARRHRQHRGPAEAVSPARRCSRPRLLIAPEYIISLLR